MEEEIIIDNEFDLKSESELDPESEKKTKSKSISLKNKKAKKDHRIVHNGIDINIKEGDELEPLGIPKLFWPNLKTEGVI